MSLYKSTELRISTYSNGIDGRSINEIKNFYYATKTDRESLPVAGDSKWKESVSALSPAFSGEYKYLWNYEHIIYSTGAPTNTTPMILGTWGPGFDNIYEYYIITAADSAPDTPEEQADGSWPDEYVITDVGTWVLEKEGATLPKPTKDLPYLWNYEILNFNDGTD